ncbi:hypothetical protein HanIR_Chr16g0814061 [Helianthus annuus]|nr:hypothetical protein HanIR_Chr16g0814061 [Helianthus annuus]
MSNAENNKKCWWKKKEIRNLTLGLLEREFYGQGDSGSDLIFNRVLYKVNVESLVENGLKNFLESGREIKDGGTMAVVSRRQR